MKLIKTKGIVLKETNFEESSKILTVLTSDFGKIQVLSKNCRRLLSVLSAVSQPLMFCEFVIRKTKDIYSISSASVIESFFELSQDVNLAIYSGYLIELVDSFLEFEQKNEDVLRLLLNSLYLLKKRKDPEVVSRIFEIKILVYTGFFPQFTQCVKCQRKDITRAFFSFKNGGLTCEACKEDNDIEIEIEVVKRILIVAATNLKKLNKILFDSSLNSKIKTITLPYIKMVLQKDIKILDFFRFIQ